MMTDTIEVFISYAPDDKELFKTLEAHLGALRRQDYVNIWGNRDIPVGSKWADEIDRHLKAAHIILLLISADFLASDYCCTVEMKRAMERHEQEGTCVVPILIRPYSWQNTPLAQFDILPRSHVPVTESPDSEEAFRDIAKELRYFVENLSINKWRDKADKLYREGKYKDALLIYEKILRLKNSLAVAVCRGNILNELQEYEEALYAYDTYSPAAWFDKSPWETKNNIDEYQYYKEALQVYKLIFQQDVPQRFDTHWLGMVQEDIPKTVDQSFLERLNRAIHRSPMNPFLYHLKGNILFRLEQYREALGAYEQATQLQEEFDLAHQYLSKTLENIGQQEYKKFNILARLDLQDANKLRDQGPTLS